MAKSTLSELRDLSRERTGPVLTVPFPRFRWKTRILLPGIILGGIVGLMVVSSYKALVPATQVRAAPVVLKTVSGPVTGTVSVQAAGWVESDPYKYYVAALADGVVREVLVLEGETVEQGQATVRLVDDDAKLAVQKAEATVADLEAAVAAAKADLSAATDEWDNPVERTRAIRIAEAQLAENRAALDETRSEIVLESARLDQAKSDYDRGVLLHETKSISESEFIRLRSLHDAQRAKVEAVKNRIPLIEARIAKHEAELDAAKDHMRLRTEEKRTLERARAAVLRADAAFHHGKTVLQEARLRLERMEIRSPISGIVMKRLTEPGSKVVVVSDNPTSAYVLSLYDPKRLQVRVDVPLADAGKIQLGQTVQIAAEVLPDRVFHGTVTRVLHEANIQKNTLEAKVAITDPDPKLRPEMLTRVKFLAKTEQPEGESGEITFVPESGLLRQGGNVTAIVVKDFDGTLGVARTQTVQPGSVKSDGWVDVRSGVQPGDLVITKAPHELHDGERVRVLIE